ncbi:hypothetical protein SE916_06235 [Pseudomonas sp. 5FOS]|uniref:hypothetical protein n=1 Tax=unclassified Pseudomonas TaxID=196821 RepID=UPI002FE145AB
MDEQASTTAITLELLLLDPVTITAAPKELSLCVSQRGSIRIHENVITALVTLDTQAGAISDGLERPRG